VKIPLLYTILEENSPQRNVIAWENITEIQGARAMQYGEHIQRW
jgi:hypothetical protein